MRTELAPATVPNRLHQFELARATHQWGVAHRPLGWAGQRPHRQPRGHGFFLALRLDPLAALVQDRVARRAIRLLADEQPAFGRGGLETRRRVDDVPRGERVTAAGVERDDGLAGVHCGPGSEVERVVTIQVADCLQDAKTRADGALGVVAVRGRRAEHGEHGVADELLEDTAILLDSALGLGVIQLERLADVFGIGTVRAGGEADEVHEQDGDELPFLAGWRCVHEARAAAAAEPRFGENLRAAARAPRRARLVTVRRHPGSVALRSALAKRSHRICPSASPTRFMPIFSSTRTDATLSGSHLAMTRSTPGWSSPHSASARPASEA